MVIVEMSLSLLQNGNVSLQSPNGAAPGSGGIAAAKYSSFTQVGLENHTVSSSPSTTDSSSSLSPIASLSASSPTSSISAAQQQSLFQQGLLVADPRSPALLLHATAVSPTAASPLTEEEMDDTGPFICCWENCNQEFPQLESLVGHLDRDHTLAMDKYVCQWKDCARSRKPFDARYKLITHLRCHTGEKPYRCEYPTCTRSFSRLENLKLHVRTHTGEKPYECHYEGCTKKFNNTSDRAKHMKTHITRKPYVCKYPGCGKSYTDPSSMRKHIKYTHKLKERQEEHDSHGLTNGSSQRGGSRKRSTSGSSTSPITPTTPGPRFIHPGIVSINGQLIQTLPSPPVFTSTSAGGPPISVAAAQQQQQPQLIQVPLVQIPNVPSSIPQPLSFLAPGSSPLLSQGAPAVTHQQPSQPQQQQVVMLLPTPGIAANAASRDILTVSPHPQNTIAKLQQQQNLVQKQPPLPPIQILQQAVSDSRAEQQSHGQSAAATAVSVPKSEADLEEQLRQQIAHLQQQLVQSQQAQLLAQQQVAQLQMKQQQQVQAQAVDKNENQERKVTLSPNGTTLPNHTAVTAAIVSSGGGANPTKMSPSSKVAIVTSSWSPVCGNNTAAVAVSSVPAATLVATTIAPPLTTVKSSQPSITSQSFLSSSHSPVAARASKTGSSSSGGQQQQILLTSSVPTTILQSPTGHAHHHHHHQHHSHHQTAVLPVPTHVPCTVMLGQATATTTGAAPGPGPQVIPIVQSQGVQQRQILYMTPNTS